MPEIIYIEANGHTHRHEVPVGLSLMRGAVDNGVPGILADCGGACACATCQVLVDPEWSTRLPPAAAMEQSMIEEAREQGMTRRLSCQIQVSAALDGLKVHIPSSQYGPL